MKIKTVALLIDVEKFIPAKNYKSRLDCVKKSLLPMCAKLSVNDRILLCDDNILCGSGHSASAVNQFGGGEIHATKVLRKMIDCIANLSNDDIHYFIITDKQIDANRFFRCIKHDKTVNAGRDTKFHFITIGNSVVMEDVDVKFYQDASDIKPEVFIDCVFGADKVLHRQDKSDDFLPLNSLS